MRSLIKEARDRQRRRRRAISGVLALSLVIAALVFVIGGRGSAPSPTAETEPTLTARDFAKYRLSCYALREASIPIGPQPSRWCKTFTPPVRLALVTVAPLQLQRDACQVLRDYGIPVASDTSQGCRLRITVVPHEVFLPRNV